MHSGRPKRTVRNSGLLKSCKMVKEAKGKNKLPTSGSEPVLDMKKWSSRKGIGNGNCYSFALDNYSSNRPIKATPGDRTSTPGLDAITCPILRKKLLADNPSKVTPVAAKTRCNKGSYKIYMAADKNGNDFHFYRQVGDIKYQVQPGDTLQSIAKFFSISVAHVKACNPKLKNPLKPKSVIYLRKINQFIHKRGFSSVFLTNAKGKRIDNPAKPSTGDYSKTEAFGLNYSKSCGFYCVKPGAKSSR
jgi:LysM domain